MVTPEMRTKALLDFFGWSGGTIHQLSEETGLPVAKLLYHSVELCSTLQPLVREGYETARNFPLQQRLSAAKRIKKDYAGQPELWDFYSGAITGLMDV